MQVDKGYSVVLLFEIEVAGRHGDVVIRRQVLPCRGTPLEAVLGKWWLVWLKHGIEAWPIVEEVELLPVERLPEG